MRIKSLTALTSEELILQSIVPDAEPVEIPETVAGCKFEKVGSRFAFIIQEKGKLRYAYFWNNIPAPEASSEEVQLAVFKVLEKLHNLFPKENHLNLSVIVMGGQYPSFNTCQMLKRMDGGRKDLGFNIHLDTLCIDFTDALSDIYVKRKDSLFLYSYMPYAPQAVPAQYTPLQNAKKNKKATISKNNDGNTKKQKVNTELSKTKKSNKVRL